VLGLGLSVLGVEMMCCSLLVMGVLERKPDLLLRGRLYFKRLFGRSFSF
jgi:hypothetical protein